MKTLLLVIAMLCGIGFAQTGFGELTYDNNDELVNTKSYTHSYVVLDYDSLTNSFCWEWYNITHESSGVIEYDVLSFTELYDEDSIIYFELRCIDRDDNKTSVFELRPEHRSYTYKPENPYIPGEYYYICGGVGIRFRI